MGMRSRSCIRWASRMGMSRRTNDATCIRIRSVATCRSKWSWPSLYVFLSNSPRPVFNNVWNEIDVGFFALNSCVFSDYSDGGCFRGVRNQNESIRGQNQKNDTYLHEVLNVIWKMRNRLHFYREPSSSEGPSQGRTHSSGCHHGLGLFGRVWMFDTEFCDAPQIFNLRFGRLLVGRRTRVR